MKKFVECCKKRFVTFKQRYNHDKKTSQNGFYNLLPVNVQISSDILVIQVSLSIPAMASYLYIVKYELPIVIKAFLDTNDR